VQVPGRVPIAAAALACALLAALPSGAVPHATRAAAAPFRGGEYRVAGKDWETVLFTFRTTRDLRWVRSNPMPQYHYENCRLGSRRVSLWAVFELRAPMRLASDGRFARLDAWPRVSGRFSADGATISVRLRNRPFVARSRAGSVRCPALDRRFEALVYLPAGDYAGTTAQGHPVSFTLGGAARTHVTKLAFGVTLACEPEGSVTHTYAGLSGQVDVSGSPRLELSSDGESSAGGTRRSSVGADWLGTAVRGDVSASWQPPEPDPEDETSPVACETPEDGVPFTARLVRRASGT
jgi:hypothetical protein